MAHEWDAATYDRVADPHARWGGRVLDWLELAGDERVLDAGCGSGRVTQQLLERLPRGSVVALDASETMLGEAARRLAPWGDRVQFVRADLGGPLPVDRTFDAVLSTAALHWVADHAAVYRGLAAVLRPGGRLAAQYGGAGNIASVVDAVRRVGGPAADWPGPWVFATPDDTRRHLVAAGFDPVDAWLQEEPTLFADREALETFLRTVVLGSHLARLPGEEHAAFVRAVADRLPGLALDYVRLNVVARLSDR